MNNKSSKEKFIWWRDGTQIFIAIILLFTLIYIVCQFGQIKKANDLTVQGLQEIKKQTELTEKSFKQTYRPIGYTDIVKKEPFEEEILVINYIDTRDTLKYRRIEWHQELKNEGKGILFYIGVFTFFSKEPINFINTTFIINLENSIIDSTVYFDIMEPQARYHPLKTAIKDTTFLYCIVPEDLFKPPLYFYSISIYKDISDNLYETASLMYCRSFFFDKKTDKISVFGSVLNHYFNEYSAREHNELYEFCLSKGKNIMARCIGKK